MSQSKTTGTNRHSEISHHECRAMRALKCDGYTHSEIAFMFEAREGTVGRHVRHECTHELKEPKPSAREGHKEHTDSELVIAYRSVYQKQPYDRMSHAAYDRHRDADHPSASTIQRRFGSWQTARQIVWGQEQ